MSSNHIIRDTLFISSSSGLFTNLDISGDFAKGAYFKASFPNPTGEIHIGKNGNSMAIRNYEGGKVVYDLLLVRGSDGHKALLSQLNSQFSGDSLGFLTCVRTLVLNVDGVIQEEVIRLVNGIVTKCPDSTSDSSSAVEQTIAACTIEGVVSHGVFASFQ